MLRVSVNSRLMSAGSPFLKSDDPKVRRQAANKFSWLRHFARPHLNHLILLLKDQDADVRRAAASALNDITSGSNGSCGGTYLCSGTAGYDGPTGVGTPNGTAGF